MAHERVRRFGCCDELIAEVLREIKKDKPVVLAGAVAIGKSAVLEAAAKLISTAPRPAALPL